MVTQQALCLKVMILTPKFIQYHSGLNFPLFLFGHEIDSFTANDSLGISGHHDRVSSIVVGASDSLRYLNQYLHG